MWTIYSQSPGECEKKKTANYHCTKSHCGYSGYSTSNMPTETTRLKERKMIQTIAIVGRVSTVKILSKIKTNLYRCAHP